MDEDKAIRAAKLTLGGMLEKRRAAEAKQRAPGQIAPSKYLPGVPRAAHADGGEVADLGQAREQKQLQGYHKGMMGDLRDRMTNAMEAHQKAVDAGVFDGYEIGDTLQGSAHPMRITGKYMQKWKPTSMALQSFERMGTKPTIVEHEGEQYIPMLRYQTGAEGQDGFQEGAAYLDGVKAAGYQKMGGLRSVKAAGGAVLPKGYTIHVDKDRFGVLGRYNGKNVAQLTLNRNKDDGSVSAFQMAVHPKHQRKGLMSAMHDAAEEAFGPLQPDATLTDEGFAFWKGYRPDAMSNRLRFYRDNLIGKQINTAYGAGKVKSVADRGMVAELDDKDGATAYVSAKNSGDMLRANGIDPDKITYSDGGSVAERSPMFEGIHPDLQDEQGNPKELWHGTPGEPFNEFKDEKLGKRDTGFYGRGHYLTPDYSSAEEYADPNQMAEGNVMGPLHAALKNPYVWDMSNETKAYSTLKDLHSMGIMTDRNTRMNPWDNLKSHEINRFMEHMGKRGHDGVIVKQPNWQDGEGGSVSEIVVFKPSAIKHKDAERFDPNDPNIYRANGGAIK